MKKALQNPYIVGILAIVALGIVVRSIFKKPPSYYPGAAQEQTSDANASKGGKGKSKTRKPGKRIDAALAEWTASFGRDPFSASPDREPETEIVADEAEIEPLAPDLQLSAVWLDRAHKLAVINGVVLEVGDRILGYEVTEILADRIILNASGSRAVIRFPERSEDPVRRVAYHVPEPN